MAVRSRAANARTDGADRLTSIVAEVAASSPLRADDRKREDLVPTAATAATGRQGRLADEWTHVEFRPARWLVVALALLGLSLVRPKLGVLLAVAWRFFPRRLKLIAGGVAAFALVLLAGSVAALVLVLNQLA